MKKQLKNKKRNKKVLLLAALGTFGIVGGTFGGTYAWFVAQRTAQATVGNITASASGNLEMNWANAGWANTAADDDHVLTDISGDGATFFRPQIAPGSTSAAYTFSGINATTSGYYSATVQFRADKALEVYVGASSVTSTQGTGTTNELDGALRVAFVSGTDVIQILHDNNADTTYNYISGTTIDAAGAPSATTAISTQEYKDMTTLTTRTSTAAASSATTSESIASITAANTPVSVTVTFWLEGQDSHCINANQANTLSVELNFYALDPTDNI